MASPIQVAVLAVVVILPTVLLAYVLFAPRPRIPGATPFEPDLLCATMHGPNVVFSLRRRVCVGLSHVTGVQVVADAERLPRGRVFGTVLRGGRHITAGFYSQEGKTSSWAVYRARPALAIELRDERY